METSESIKEIAAALCLAQSEMTGATKTANNPFLKSNYADLADVMKAISKPFADNGLSFIQAPEMVDGQPCVTTRIMHNSGEWIQCATQLPPTKNDAQGHGSAFTYAKRYGLQGLAGVPSTDDDGNDAALHAEKKSEKTPMTPNHKNWDGVITAFKRDGNLVKVLDRHTMTDEHQALAQDQANVA